MAKRIGVLLSGCGYLDGAEIHEATLTLYFLDKAGATVINMAPDKAQADVMDHNVSEAAEGSRNVLIESSRIARGKVRDVYDLGDRLLMVASDRISAFDVVMPTAILDKGRLLNGLSLFWFDRLDDVVPNHIITTEFDGLDVSADERAWLDGRAVVVKKAEVLPVECIARGYVIGSGWKDYQASGRVCGIELPPDLQQAQQLPEVLFTPSTKAEMGEHDENINFEQCAEIIGLDLANQVRDYSIEIYSKARDYAETKGILIADTKFEFGLIENDELILIDEVLTPDSSRFWPKGLYEAGRGQQSYDKQFVRDYLTSVGWDKNPPAPDLPEDIAKKTSDKYIEALSLLTA